MLKYRGKLKVVIYNNHKYMTEYVIKDIFNSFKGEKRLYPAKNWNIKIINNRSFDNYYKKGVWGEVHSDTMYIDVDKSGDIDIRHGKDGLWDMETASIRYNNAYMEAEEGFPWVSFKTPIRRNREPVYIDDDYLDVDAYMDFWDYQK